MVTHYVVKRIGPRISVKERSDAHDPLTSCTRTPRCAIALSYLSQTREGKESQKAIGKEDVYFCQNSLERECLISDK